MSSVLVADLRHQRAEVLKECHIVWNGVAVRQNPIWIFGHEIDQRGHVIPPPQIQSEAVLTEIKKKFSHLIREWMRLYQRHALYVVRGQPFVFGQSLEQVAPPERFLTRLALGNVNREIVR